MTKRKKSQKKIGFQILPCVRCRATRILGQSCPECGLKPQTGEVNALVVQRRTAVRRIEEELCIKDTDERGGNQILPSKEEIATYLSDFIAALSGLIANPSSADSIAQIVHVERSLAGLRDRCSRHAPLRPSIAKFRAVARSLAILAELWPTYAEALRAPTMEAAKHLSENGQKVLDAAVDEINEYERLVESTQAYEDLSIPDFLDRALAALSISHPHLSLLDLGRLGAEEATSIANVPTDGGHGAQYFVLNAVASAHLDVERFRTVLRSASQVCAESHQLTAVASEAGALESLAGSTRMLYEALASFEAVLLRESDEQALMRRTIKFYGEVYEDVAGPLFAWYSLLAGIKKQPYAKLLQADVATLARGLAEHAPTTSFLEDAGANLRNAAQHGNSFSLEGERVIFTLRSYRETLSRAQVVDQVFSLLESAAAMSWSLSNALAQAGHAVPMKESDAAYMNLSPLRLVTLWLTDRGTHLLKAENAEASWDFTVQTDPKETFELALAIGVGAPEVVAEVSVHAPNNDAPLRVPLSAYAQFLTVTGPESLPADHLLGLLEFRNACTVSGRSLLKVSDMKFAAATLGISFLVNGELAQLPYLRRSLKLASSLEDPKVAAVIRRVFDQNRAPDAIKLHYLKGKLKGWIDKYHAPAMPQSAAVTVYR